MGWGCPEESREGGLTITGDLLEEDDREWLVALKAALVPLRLEGAGGPSPGRQGAPWPIQGPPLAKGDPRKTRPAPRKGAMSSKAGEAAAGKKPRCPNSPGDPDDDEIQVVKVQQGGLTLPTRVKERPYERDDQWWEAIPLVAGEGRMVVKKLAAGAYITGCARSSSSGSPRGEVLLKLRPDGRPWLPP